MPVSKELMSAIYQAGQELLEDLAMRQERRLEMVNSFMAEVMEKAEKSSDPHIQALAREFSRVEVQKRLTVLETIAELVDVDWKIFFHL
jgi:hypothetical protein